MGFIFRDDIAKELILGLVDNSYKDLTYEEIQDSLGMEMDQIIKVCKDLEEEGLLTVEETVN